MPTEPDPEIKIIENDEILNDLIVHASLAWHSNPQFKI